MAARRGKGGKFVKSKGKGRKHGKHKSHSGAGPVALLHKMDKKLTRIDHKLNPERWSRIKGKRRARHEEAELAAKYG